jgi:quercetin dioxygenase-like cupin family protein
MFEEGIMPVIHASEAETHQMHGTAFISYAVSGRGSSELRAWRVEIPAGTTGVAHRVTREEVLYVLGGTVRVHLDSQITEANAGDAIVVPGGARFAVDNVGGEPATAWVSTSAGFAAILSDGTWITPPWTR